MKRGNKCSEEGLEKFEKERLECRKKVVHVCELKDALVSYLSEVSILSSRT